MSFDFVKHRKERKRFSVDFVDRLDVSEALSGTPSVTVRSGEWWNGTDVTDQFLDGTPTIEGESVEFWLLDDENQPVGNHGLVVRVDTDAGRKIIAKDENTKPIILRVV